MCGPLYIIIKDLMSMLGSGFMLLYSCVLFILLTMYFFTLVMYIRKWHRMEYCWQWLYPAILLFIPVFGPIPVLLLLTIGVGLMPIEK